MKKTKFTFAKITNVVCAALLGVLGFSSGCAAKKAAAEKTQQQQPIVTPHDSLQNDELTRPRLMYGVPYSNLREQK